jgi:hypothetical protein
LLEYFARAVRGHLKRGERLTRFVVTRSDAQGYRCDIGILDHANGRRAPEPDTVFRFVRRKMQGTKTFNVALVVPTGVGCEIGGHAGDANPVAALLAGACDTLITHPNVVNASDIIELPANALYLEGSVLTRLFMGTIGLQSVRANRVLVVIDEHRDAYFTNAAINAVSAARACYGLECPSVVRMAPPIRVKAEYNASGRAAGYVEGLERLQDVLDQYRSSYDAVAIATVVEVPSHYHLDYFKSNGEMINPWGGVEAMLTHWLSLVYDVPSAHSPMLESQEVMNIQPGIVDTRMAAESISFSFMQCILKGLQRSPRIVTDPVAMQRADVLTAADLSCLVIPDGCLGLPTLAALEQGIPVIAVRENRNIMRNDLSALPWGARQFYRVENYWEACGVLMALRQGLAPEAVRRPLAATTVEQHSVQVDGADSSNGGTPLGPQESRQVEPAVADRAVVPA